MASSVPCRAPRNTAPGRARRRAAAAGPSPTMTSRTPGSPATCPSRSTRFSGASRPTYPTSSSPPGASSCRSRGLRRAGSNRSVSTPRPHSHTRCTPCSRRLAALAADGARVRSAALWMRRSHRHAAASPSPARYDAGVGGHVGLVDGHRGQAFPAGGGDGGRAEDERAREVDQFGAVAGQRGVQLPDRQADPEAAVTGQRHGGQPHHRPRERAAPPAPGAFRAGAGAMTIGWCPRKTRCSATRSAQCATPFTSGGKDSATIATRTLTT